MAEVEEIITQPSEAEKRINQLSGTVKSMSEERDQAQKVAAEAEAKAAEAARERDFYASFSDLVATNPLAKDHKDEILEKVKGGYTTEDATFAVLGKAGKLGNTPVAEPVSPAGGSASTALPSNGIRSVQEMTQQERRAALLEAEQRGDIGMT